MVRERDHNLNVGPNRTEADIHRLGYVSNPNIGIANTELPRVRDLPGRRIRSEGTYQQEVVGEVMEEISGTLSLSKTSL